MMGWLGSAAGAGGNTASTAYYSTLWSCVHIVYFSGKKVPAKKKETLTVLFIKLYLNIPLLSS